MDALRYAPRTSCLLVLRTYQACCSSGKGVSPRPLATTASADCLVSYAALVTLVQHTMRLTDIAARIFGKSKPQELLPPLERSSTELTRARLTTRRNSLENSHFVPDYAHEELHTVCPR